MAIQTEKITYFGEAIMVNTCWLAEIEVSNLHMIHGKIEVNACAKCRKKIFIGVGDMHPDGQKFQKWCQFEQTK